MKSTEDVENLVPIVRGKLYPYNNNSAVYHCPADQGVTIRGQDYASVRSYSMNSYMGGRRDYRYKSTWKQAIPASPAGYAPFYEKESDLPAPSRMWVLIEEDERTISDGFFTFDPTGKTYQKRLPATTSQRHNAAFGLAFGDGHVEMWRFKEPSASLLSSTTAATVTGSDSAKDFKKLGEVTAIPR